MISSQVEKLRNRKNLTALEMEEVMGAIMSGQAAQNEMAAFLLALREKGASIDEITAAAKVMRRFSGEIKTRHRLVLDICGTGGDKKGTFNISTISAFVAAAVGVAVAKHGNRSVSSQCGSADLLEAMGINLETDEENLGQCLDQVGIAFLFAQKLHPAMKNVAPVRKKLGVETIFNVLGPLCNPAKATHQVMGVYDRNLVLPMAHVLKNLGLKRALVVHGSDGLDEITTTGITFASEYNGKEVISYPIDPNALGIKKAKLDDLKGGDIKSNVRIARRILDGHDGPRRDIVVVNAACALYLGEMAASVEEGIALAKESIDSGKAKEKLEALRKFTNCRGVPSGRPYAETEGEMV